MKRCLVLLALTALLMASSTEARRLWQFPSFASSTPPAVAGSAPAGPAAAGATPGQPSTTGSAGAASATPGSGTQQESAEAAPKTDSQTISQPAGAAGAPAAAATGTANATGPSTAVAGPAGTTTSQPATASATATATGTPGKPGTAVAAADSTRGVAAGATGAAAATATAGNTTAAAEGEEGEGEEAEAAAAPAGPKVLRPGVYVIADPPPPPKKRPAAPADVNGTAAGVAGRNATVGPPMPTPGKNLMVVMTVMGQQARDIYKNQKALKEQVAQAAGVNNDQVLFFNQTTNQDPRTGVTAMSLIMNVDCSSQAECAQAGAKLYNATGQTRLTDALARNSISMLPGTFQVYGVQQMGKYKGNTTLYENKAFTAIKPKSSDSDYNSTLARVFAGMEAEQPKGTKGAKDPAGVLPGALPGDIPLAGPGVFGNFSIPMDPISSGNNFSLPQSTLGGMQGLGNGSLLPAGGFNALPADLPGMQNATAPEQQAAEPKKAKSSAGSFSAAVLPVLAAAAAAAVLVL